MSTENSLVVILLSSHYLGRIQGRIQGHRPYQYQCHYLQQVQAFGRSSQAGSSDEGDYSGSGRASQGQEREDPAQTGTAHGLDMGQGDLCSGGCGGGGPLGRAQWTSKRLPNAAGPPQHPSSPAQHEPDLPSVEGRWKSTVPGESARPASGSSTHQVL